MTDGSLMKVESAILLTCIERNHFSVFLRVAVLHRFYCILMSTNCGISLVSVLFDIKITRNVSMGHGCPRCCQIRINRALSLTKRHISGNYRWILSVIKLDLFFMIIYLCMKYESNTPMYSKGIIRKPFLIRWSRAITLIMIGGFYPWSWIQFTNVFKRYSL